MQLHRDSSENINIVRAVGAEGVRVGDKLVVPPCVIAVSAIVENWAVTDVAGLVPDQLDAVIALEPEVIVLGCGPVIRFPAAEITRAVNRHGIGLEVMDTAAGCRTYNLLAHEGRNVALALLSL